MITATLVRRYQLQLGDLTRRVDTEAQRIWRTVAGVTQADLDRWLAAIEPLVAAGQQLHADLYAAFMSEALDELVASPDVAALGPLRAGVETAEGYARPIITARHGLSTGASFAGALRQGSHRVGHLVTTDMQLAHRAAANDTFRAAGDRVVGYRRVLTGDSCALCAVASTQRYSTEDLMPIHDHCDCGIAPIIGDADPGHVINRDLLRDIQQDTDRRDYWNDRNLRVTDDGTVLRADDSRLEVTEVTHGEKGPFLAEADHQFTQI